MIRERRSELLQCLSQLIRPSWLVKQNHLNLQPPQPQRHVHQKTHRPWKGASMRAEDGSIPCSTPESHAPNDQALPLRSLLGCSTTPLFDGRLWSMTHSHVTSNIAVGFELDNDLQISLYRKYIHSSCFSVWWSYLTCKFQKVSLHYSGENHNMAVKAL